MNTWTWWGRTSAWLMAGLLALGVFAPVVHADDDDSGDDDLDELIERGEELPEREEALEEELDELNEWLEEAREKLTELTEKLEQVESELSAIDQQLEIAEQEREAAEERLEEAEERYEEAEERVEEAEEELEEREELLERQLAYAYKYGDTSALQLLDAALNQDRTEDVVEGLHQLEHILEHENENVLRLADLHDEARIARAQADGARDRRDEELESAERSEESVEELLEEQEELRDEVEEQREEQERLVEQIEEDRDEAEGLLEEISEELATRREEAEEAARADGDLVCPVPSGSFIDDWHFPRSGGRLHEGNDIFADRGEPIHAPEDGVVARVDETDDWSPGSSSGLGGKTVNIRSEDDVRWYFAHLDEIDEDIESGVSVEAGDVIGTVGTTGNARHTPPHLHLGRYLDGEAENPYPHISEACR
ncbi:M23 family metallopeptidase [Egibacter rhizosphaerae]|uniref:M23 family metallopeptidase n=1 Tax=Egibacter rhizosphaerae TaxID=1670831 RepID=UPI001F115A75|nr:M23 family metallopeptidase [Egibacter rhizosphaerae]